MDFFLTLLIAFILAFVLGKIANVIGLARVVGYIIAGLILSTPFFNLRLFDQTIINSFEGLADFGIILLFFFAGLKISIPEFKKNLRESFSISILNTILPFAVVLVFCLFLGIEFKAAIILALVGSVSAQAVIVDVLDELGLLNSKLGQLIVNAGSVDDIVELLLLTIILGLVGLSTGIGIIQFFINLALFVAVIVSAKLIIIPNLLKVFSPTSSPEALFGWSLAVALLMGVLSNTLGFGVIAGALISGVLVRHSLSIDNRKPWQEHSISNNIHLIGFGFFIPIFFVWIGYKTNLGVTFEQPFLIVSLFVLSFVFGMAGTWLGVILNRGTKLEGILVALAMGTKGDVELAIGLVAFKAGVITNEIFSVIVIIAILSSIIPPILFKHFIQKYIDKENPFYKIPAKAQNTS